MNNRKCRFLFALFLIIIFSGCSGANQGPIVGPIQGVPVQVIEVGSKLTLAVNASGNNISFQWETNGGTFTSDETKPSVEYQAPMQAGQIIITVTVTDRNNQSNVQNISLTVVAKPTQTSEPTLTPIPSATLTSEPTFTVIPSATLTSVPTLTMTPSFTWTPTLTFTPTLTYTPTPEPYIILKEDGKLANGLGMGVNTFEGKTNWAGAQGGEIRMAFPGSKAWGSVFITVGNPRNYNRPSKNFNAYQVLYFEIKGEKGGEKVFVGLKDNTNKNADGSYNDDGSETKRLIDDITTEYQTIAIPLPYFYPTDLQNLYTVVEFVFEKTPYTIYVRNIQYLR